MTPANWQWQIRNQINSPARLPVGFRLTAAEQAFFQTSGPRSFGMATTPYYFSLIDPADPADPIRRQVIPQIAEQTIKPYEQADPLAESHFTVAPGLIRRYPDRALLHATRLCAVNCRHCFRRALPAMAGAAVNPQTLSDSCQYLKNNPRISEVLISGGDPLMLEDDLLLAILTLLRKTSQALVLRICTRMPVVLPQRITLQLATALKQLQPVWVATHFNHPAEITTASRQALSLLLDNGIPVVNQTVLLRGVNDNPGILKQLCRSLVQVRVKPYYLLQGDLAPGTSHLRINMGAAVALYREMAAGLSGLALPKLAVDAPGGGGKILLQATPEVVAGQYQLRDSRQQVFPYPVEDGL